MLHILHACLLLFGKPPLFLHWFTYYLHKSGSLKIDAISKIVAYVVWMTIDLIVNNWAFPSTSLSKTRDHRSTLMSLWELAMPKKRVTNP
jgi:hypothetical protein